MKRQRLKKSVFQMVCHCGSEVTLQWAVLKRGANNRSVTAGETATN